MSRHWFTTDVILPVVATRALLLLVGALAIALIPRSMDPGKWEFSHYGIVNMWSRWDAGWYLGIAKDGYTYQAGEFTRVCFFPLYPMLMRGAAWLVGRSDPEGFLIAGILVSNVALVVAVGYLVALARREFGKETAARAALYLLVFPTSSFLSAVYPESLFLAVTIGAFYHARRTQWWAAGALAGLATLTRPLGFLVLIPLAYEYAVQRGLTRRVLLAGALALAPIPLCYAAWCAFLYRAFGDPWISVTAQSAWGRRLSFPWETVLSWFDGPAAIHGPDHSVLDLLFTGIFALLVWRCWRILRPAYALMASIILAGALCSGTLTAMMRFALEAFPIFLVLAVAGRDPWVDRAYLILSAALGSLFMALFALWYWVA